MHSLSGSFHVRKQFGQNRRQHLADHNYTGTNYPGSYYTYPNSNSGSYYTYRNSNSGPDYAGSNYSGPYHTGSYYE